MSNNIRITFFHGLDVSHASKSCMVLPVIHHGLYVMCKGLHVIQGVCLTHATTVIVIHECCNDVTM